MSRSVSGFAVVFVLVSLPFLAWGAWDWQETRRGKEIVRDMPAYPGARIVGRSSDQLSYELPRGTSPTAVDRFYRRRLAGWKGPQSGCRGFRRGRDLVLVGVDVFDARYLKILVKPGEAGNCDEWTWFLDS